MFTPRTQAHEHKHEKDRTEHNKHEAQCFITNTASVAGGTRTQHQHKRLFTATAVNFRIYLRISFVLSTQLV